jgi:hypothetical protein
MMEILVDLFSNEFGRGGVSNYVWNNKYNFAAAISCDHIVTETMVNLLYVGEYYESPIVGPLVE